MKLKLLFLLTILTALPTYAGTVTGQLQGPSGLPVKNGTLTFKLNQVGLIAGTGAVANTTAQCWTDALGNVVGAPNPLVLPNMAANYGSGAVLGGIYYTVYTFLTSSGQSAPSPEARIQLTGTGSIVIQPPASIPANVTGITYYIGTTSGGEQAQATSGTTAVYTQSTPPGSGTAPPTSNTSTCQIAFNDQIIPYMGYGVSLISASGNAYPGWPQSWQLNGGASGTINVSQGAPLWNGVVVYPMPILSQPLNNGPQSISGSLSLGNYGLTAGTVNATTGYQYQGAAGTQGQTLVSNGQYFVPGSILGQRVVYASQVPGVTSGVTVVPGSSATGTTDSAAAINAAIAGGNVDLEVDSGFALSTSLVLSSNTTIHCVAPQYGFIMQAAANTPVLINAHTNAPTTSNGTGGYLVSNLGETNLRITGCTLNANSTQAVTGSNVLGTPHTTTGGSSPKFVMGVEFYAVHGLVFEHNELYDTGAFAFYGSNDRYIYNDHNYYHQPTPTVHFKNTDGFHLDGPIQFVWSNHNRINAGDDSISYAADDGQTPGTGDPNGPYIKSFVKWGNVTDIEDTDEIFDNTFFGIRLLSTNDLMDRIEFTNINGTACGNTGTLSAAYPSVGPGNLGAIKIDGWNVVTSGACNDYGQAFNFNISSNIQALTLSHLQLKNPGVNWPVIYQNAGNVALLSLRNWDLYTAGVGLSAVLNLSGGAVNQVSASGINWLDLPTHATSYFATGSGGNTQVFTLSNYAGPNRVLASGYAPPIQNGDAFSNTYPLIYVSTTFNEAGSGALAGTAPATCAHGCTGTWTAASGGPASGAWAYSTTSATISGACASGGVSHTCPVYINAGVSNYTVDAYLSTIGDFSFALRWTNSSNLISVTTIGGNFTAYDCVSGTCTQVASAPLAGVGTYAVTLNGNYIALYTPTGYAAGTVSSSNTGNLVGINSTATSTTTAVVNGFTVAGPTF